MPRSSNDIVFTGHEQPTRRNNSTVKHAGKFTQIIPLEQAFSHVEEELVTLAVNTTKVAKALGVSQATVRRKYREIVNRHKTEIVAKPRFQALEIRGF